MTPLRRWLIKVLTLGTMLVTGMLVVAGSSSAVGSAAQTGSFASKIFVNGARLSHKTSKGTEPLTKPDDITTLGGRIFIAFQNGVGPQGEPSTTGSPDSTVVEFTTAGDVAGQWDLVGKCDGLTADPALGKVLATVNEDAHSSFYEITPAPTSKPVHYSYSRPLGSKGGTDAIAVYAGMLLFSASAPGTTGAAAPRASYPAVYRVILRSGTHVAKIVPLFGDEASARLAGGRKSVKLALTDPDSNATVPAFSLRFGGDFELTGQGDKEQIYVQGAGTAHQRLVVLKLSDSVDDTVWTSSRTGTIYASNGSNDTVEKITGPFGKGQAYVADTPCDASGAPSACPGPGFPAHFLGRLNTSTGKIVPVAVHGSTPAPGGMLFLP